MDVDDIIRIVLIHMNHKGHFDRIRKRVRDGLTLSMLPKDDSKGNPIYIRMKHLMKFT